MTRPRRDIEWPLPIEVGQSLVAAGKVEGEDPIAILLGKKRSRARIYAFAVLAHRFPTVSQSTLMRLLGVEAKASFSASVHAVATIREYDCKGGKWFDLDALNRVNEACGWPRMTEDEAGLRRLSRGQERQPVSAPIADETSLPAQLSARLVADVPDVELEAIPGELLNELSFPLKQRVADLAMAKRSGHKPVQEAPPPRKKEPVAWHAEARQMYAGGLHLRVIGERLGKSYDAVRWALDINGAREKQRDRVRRSRAAPESAGAPPSRKAWLPEAISMRANGARLKDIAERFGISVPAVSVALNYHEPERKAKPEGSRFYKAGDPVPEQKATEPTPKPAAKDLIGRATGPTSLSQATKSAALIVRPSRTPLAVIEATELNRIPSRAETLAIEFAMGAKMVVVPAPGDPPPGRSALASRAQFPVPELQSSEEPDETFIAGYWGGLHSDDETMPECFWDRGKAYRDGWATGKADRRIVVVESKVEEKAQ